MRFRRSFGWNCNKAICSAGKRVFASQIEAKAMEQFKDYSVKISCRKAELPNEILSSFVSEDTLIIEGFDAVFLELNNWSSLGASWKVLAGKLLKPPPTLATIEFLSKCKNPAFEMLRTWVLQSRVKTFDLLIETMVECKLYSACDELLSILENSALESMESQKQPVGVACYDDLDIITPDEQAVSEMLLGVEENLLAPREVNEQQRTSSYSGAVNGRTNRGAQLQRSQSLPAGWFKTICRKAKRPFRRLFSLQARYDRQSTLPDVDTSPSDPIPPLPVEENEIFIVSSRADNETNAMRGLETFVSSLKPVRNGELTVKTIHDIEQNGMVTTTWLQERFDRARYVVLCFSSHMKQITEYSSDAKHFSDRTDYNLKFTMDFLVTGKIYDCGCRNPKGKFIPILLHGQDMSNLILPLRHFLHFSYPREERKISNYIMNVPEYPVICPPSPKPLVRKELCC